MSLRRRAWLLAWAASIAGCSDAHKAPPAAPPAKIAQIADESKLATIELTPKAFDRLGIVVATAEERTVQQRRVFSGETIVPPGRTIVVSAPVSGVLSAPVSGVVPIPGQKVEKGQEIFSWLPMLSPERAVLTPSERVQIAQARASLATQQVEAARQVESARVQLEAARIALSRSQKLLEERAGSQRLVDEATAQVQLASEAVETAKARHELISKIDLESEAGTQTLGSIKSPVAGVLRSLDAAAGSSVAAGARLFEVVHLDRLWVRVPLYVGSLDEFDDQANAAVADFGSSTQESARRGMPVAAPPSADPLAATADVYYEVDNRDEWLRPGQRLAVSVALKNKAKSLVVPWASVLYDIHGGAWVYEQTASRTFVRRRVEVRFVAGDEAVLSRGGLAVGAKVVAKGTAELYGAEFGFGK